MYSLQGFEGIFLFETRKSDRKHRVAGMRHKTAVPPGVTCRWLRMARLEGSESQETESGHA